jgi:hypothetical protein
MVYEDGDSAPEDGDSEDSEEDARATVALALNLAVPLIKDNALEKRVLFDDASRSCASRFRPNSTEKRFPATTGETDMYPQFSEKCARTTIQFREFSSWLLREEGKLT